MSLPKPIYLVYRNEEGAESEFHLEECSVAALVEEEDGSQNVIGLTLAEYGYENPAGTSDFEGYAYSKENAELRFGKGQK